MLCHRNIICCPWLPVTPGTGSAEERNSPCYTRRHGIERKKKHSATPQGTHKAHSSIVRLPPQPTASGKRSGSVSSMEADCTAACGGVRQYHNVSKLRIIWPPKKTWTNLSLVSFSPYHTHVSPFLNFRLSIPQPRAAQKHPNRARFGRSILCRRSCPCLQVNSGCQQPAQQKARTRS